MKRKIVILYIALLFMPIISSAQCLPPPPIIKKVTVNPNSEENVQIVWKENEKNTCETTGYEIYKYNYQTKLFERIVLTPANIFIFTDSISEAKNKPQIYRMTTKSGNAGNEHSENHHTMHLNPTVKYGQCDYSANVWWTPYKTTYRDNFEERNSEKEFNKAVRYQIWGYKIPENEKFDTLKAQPLSQITADTTIKFGIYPDQNYMFCVNAFLPNNNHSFSNIGNAKMNKNTISVPPEYIRIDSIVGYENYNRLSFEIDKNTTIIKFKIERRQAQNSEYETIFEFTDKNLKNYNDKFYNKSIEYFYRISAYNSNAECSKFPVCISDTVNNILVQSEINSNQVKLKWDIFHGAINYNIYRQGLFLSSSNTTTFIDNNIKSILQKNNYKLCYKIVAKNAKNAVSTSPEICIDFEREVIMPNAIDPTDTRINMETMRHRNQFGPIVEGGDEGFEYKMIIFDRWNNLIFETTKAIDEKMTEKHFWYGESAKNTYLPEDTYVYYVKIRFKNSNKTIEKKGTVSIIYK